MPAWRFLGTWMTCQTAGGLLLEACGRSGIAVQSFQQAGALPELLPLACSGLLAMAAQIFQPAKMSVAVSVDNVSANGAAM